MSEKLSRKEKADILKDTMGAYFRKKARAVFYELGVNRGGQLRADVTALAMNGHLTIIEVKSCRADLQTDKKWHQYAEYCNQFYFCFSKATWAKVQDLVPKDVGVFVVSAVPDTIGRVRYVPKVVQRARNKELGPEVARNLAIRAAFRNADESRGRGRRKSRSRRK